MLRLFFKKHQLQIFGNNILAFWEDNRVTYKDIFPINWITILAHKAGCYALFIKREENCRKILYHSFQAYKVPPSIYVLEVLRATILNNDHLSTCLFYPKANNICYINMINLCQMSNFGSLKKIRVNCSCTLSGVLLPVR